MILRLRVDTKFPKFCVLYYVIVVRNSVIESFKIRFVDKNIENVTPDTSPVKEWFETNCLQNSAMFTADNDDSIT